MGLQLGYIPLPKRFIVQIIGNGRLPYFHFLSRTTRKLTAPTKLLKAQKRVRPLL